MTAVLTFRAPSEIRRRLPVSICCNINCAIRHFVIAGSASIIVSWSPSFRSTPLGYLWHYSSNCLLKGHHCITQKVYGNGGMMRSQGQFLEIQKLSHGMSMMLGFEGLLSTPIDSSTSAYPLETLKNYLLEWSDLTCLILSMDTGRLA